MMDFVVGLKGLFRDFFRVYLWVNEDFSSFE
jgi:hypothetical protein